MPDPCVYPPIVPLLWSAIRPAQAKMLDLSPHRPCMPKRASAERCWRPVGATILVATPDRKTSNRFREGPIVAERFTKRPPGGHGDSWVLLLSGNCCDKLSEAGKAA